MKEINDILQAFDEAQKNKKQTALATVVHVEGSSYRRPGARMLVTEDGELTGAISGGCLEGDALRKALLVMSRQKAMLVTYDTNDEDDAKLGMGLGCNGIIQVLIEPVDNSSANNPINLLRKVAAKRQNACLVTLFSLANRKEVQPGTCLFLSKEERIVNNNHPLENILVADAKDVLEKNKSSFKNYMSGEESVTAFIEFIHPPIALVVVGAGNDVLPLVNMASILGWETTIVDGRPAYAKKERFTASCTVLLAKPHEVLQSVDIDNETVFVLMTHNYNYDKEILKALVEKHVSYIGMLGPKKKLQRMLDEFEEEGFSISNNQLSSIYNPVGIDLGAETPEEIALSIVAEIKAVLSNKKVLSLKDKTEGIHARSETTIEEVRIEQL